MATLTDRLQRLKDREARDREALSRLEGRREQLLSRLKTEFGFSNEKEALAALETMEKDVSRRRERVERLLTELEESCGQS